MFLLTSKQTLLLFFMTKTPKNGETKTKKIKF